MFAGFSHKQQGLKFKRIDLCSGYFSVNIFGVSFFSDTLFIIN